MEVQDISWFRPDGQEMTEDEWSAGWVRCLGVQLSGKTLNDIDRYGQPVVDDTFLFCLNPHSETIKFFLPACTTTCTWELVFDTRNPTIGEPQLVRAGEPYDLIERSSVLFREVERNETTG